MTADDDTKALEAAGFEVVETIGLFLDGDDGERTWCLAVRRRQPAAVESECVRMFYNALLRDRDVRAERVEELAAFRQALAREVEAAERRAAHLAQRDMAHRYLAEFGEDCQLPNAGWPEIISRATERGA